jgi:chromosome segregation ATPase
MDKIESTVPSKKKHANLEGVRAKRDLRIAWIIAALFLCSSLFLVMQLRDVDRAEQAESIARQSLNKTKEALAISTNKKDNLQDEILDLKEDKNELQSKIKGLTERKRNADETINKSNEASEEFSNLVGKIENSKKDLQELEEKLGNIKTKTDGLRKRRRDEELKVNDLENEKRELEGEVYKVKLQVQEHRDRNAEILEKEMQLKLLQEKIKFVQSQLDDVNNYLDNDKNRHDSLTKQNNSLAEDIQKQEEKYAALRTDINVLRGQRKDLIDSVNPEIELLKKRKEQLVNEVHEAEMKLSMLNSKKTDLSERESTLKSKEKDFAERKVHISSLVGNKKALEEKIKDLREDIGSFSQQLQLRKDDRKNFLNRERALMVKEKSLDSLNAEVYTLAGKKEALNTEINRLRNELGNISEKLRLRQNEVINFNPADATGRN